MDKKIICVDFDGVIHSYERGWQNGEIYGTATPGFFAWVVKAMEHFKVVVYSSRSKTPEGISAMIQAIGKWSIDAIHNGELPEDYDFGGFALTYSDVKPPAFLTIDDRAICFKGNWSTLDPAELTQFQPWNVGERSPASDFADDWNRLIGTISDFANTHNLPKPELLFHPQWLSHMSRLSEVRLAPVIIHRGVKVRFGSFEQVDALRLA